MSMNKSDWDSILQFVSEPVDIGDLAASPEKLMSEKQRAKMSMRSPQIPTPPVRIIHFRLGQSLTLC